MAKIRPDRALDAKARNPAPLAAPQFSAGPSTMNTFELKVPPPLVATTLALAMWGVSLFEPHVQVPSGVRVLGAAAFALAGIAFAVAGIVSFRRARTTVNPLKPETASALVSSGVYAITRNPMYVGLLFVLVGWTIFLSSPWALAGPLAFFAFIGRFQIAPEERALSRLFGSEYASYCAGVRRWL